MSADKLNAFLRSLADDVASPPTSPLTRQVNDILAAAQPSVPTLKQLGSLLTEMGHLEFAERLYRQMIETFPEHAQGFVGMAELAMRKANWEEGLSRWNDLSTKFNRAPIASWLGGSANALLELERLDEAEQVFRGMTQQFADDPQGWAGMARVAMAREQWTDALQSWDQLFSRFTPSDRPHWRAWRAQTLSELGRTEEAGKAFRALTEEFQNDSQAFVGLARMAMAAEQWERALQQWDEILSRFRGDDKPQWHGWRAHALCQLGRLGEAETIYSKLATDFPAQALGLPGLAHIASQRREWQLAADRWTQSISQFSTMTQPTWYLQRAKAFAEIDRNEEAEQDLRRVLGFQPESLSALVSLLGTLLSLRKFDEAARALESSPLRTNETPPLMALRLEISISLQHLDQARSDFQRFLQQDNGGEVLPALFRYAATLYSGRQRSSVYASLLEKLSIVESRSFKSPSRCALCAKIHLALRDYQQFLSVVTDAEHEDRGDDFRSLRAVAERLREPSFPDFTSPKIFGIGLSRTGTTSLTAALTALDFRTTHWFNPLTYEMLSGDDLPLFDAFTDTPVCVNFEDHYFRFPNSKFIYTTRPFESWEKSLREYFHERLGTGEFAELKARMASSDSLPHGKDFAEIHKALYFSNNSYEEAYTAYDRRVRRFFQDKPPDRFLEFDVSAGRWDVLCAFTGKPIPSVAFPWLNRSRR